MHECIAQTNAYLESSDHTTSEMPTATRLKMTWTLRSDRSQMRVSVVSTVTFAEEGWNSRIPKDVICIYMYVIVRQI